MCFFDNFWGLRVFNLMNKPGQRIKKKYILNLTWEGLFYVSFGAGVWKKTNIKETRQIQHTMCPFLCPFS